MVAIAAGFWLLIAVSWLAIMPKEIKGKSWHYVHALGPFVPMALYYFTDIPVLNAPMELYMAMGAVFFLALVALWSGKLLRHTIRTNFQVEAQPYSSLRKRYGSRWKVWSLSMSI